MAAGEGRQRPRTTISPSLIEMLGRHAHRRGARRPDDTVFRTRRGTPNTTRRYDRLFDKARHCLPWSDRVPVSAHVLRHTVIIAVGCLAGYPIAQAFAGHTPITNTGRYMQASIQEVADAVATMTGEAHPLAPSPLVSSGRYSRRRVLS